MHSVQALTLLALAGSTIAAPAWGEWRNMAQNWGGNWGQNQGASAPAATQTNVAVVTAYTTVYGNGNYGGQPSATAAPVVATTPAPKVSVAPVASPTPAAPSASAAPAPASGGYIGIVNEWRGKMNMGTLTEDSTMQANALKTVTDSNGQMEHELNPGSFAQVLAPGDAGDFEKAFVGGWLCETPSRLPAGTCDTFSQGWAYGGETGHADILASTNYKKIGCAIYAGIWACDLS